jgi:hypothetical protein
VFALEGVGVDRHGRPSVGVTQNLLGPFWRHTGFGHQGTRQMAQVVEADRRKTCLAQSAAQDVSQQLVRVDGTAVTQFIGRPRKHQVATGIGTDRFPMDEVWNQVIRNRDGPDAVGCLCGVVSPAASRLASVSACP